MSDKNKTPEPTETPVEVEVVNVPWYKKINIPKAARAAATATAVTLVGVGMYKIGKNAGSDTIVYEGEVTGSFDEDDSPEE